MRLGNVLTATAVALLCALAPAAAQVSKDGELILLSPEKTDRFVLVFEEDRAAMTPGSRARLEELSERLKTAATQVRRVLVIGTTVPTGDVAADQDLAIRRGLAARDELIRLTGLPASLFLVQASPSASQARAVGRVVIELNVEPARAGRPAPAVRPAWDTVAGRWVLVCRDGSVIPAHLAGPDDFAAAGACPGAPEVVTPVRANGPVAAWDDASAKWVLRCPDGSPLRGQGKDPDDFYAISRCAR